MITKFQDIVMQSHYERLVCKGINHNRAFRETLERFNEYDGVEE